MSHAVFRISLIAASVALLASCASFTPVSLESSAQALDASAVGTLEFAGTGRWFQFGQAPAPGEAWPPFDVSRFTTDIDYGKQAARVQITRSQVVELPRLRPAPVEQRVDQYVAGAVAWNRALPAAGSSAPGAATLQPAAVAERRAEIWSTPQGFIKAALANHATTRSTFGGTEVSFTADGKARYVGTLDSQGRVERIRTWTDTPVLGDTLLETRFSGYRDFGGLPFPTRIVRSQGSHPVLDITVTDVKRNPALSLDAPADVIAAKPAPVVVSADKLADGVYYLTGGTHHSVLIEQRDHLVIVEAPLNEERSLALIAKAKEIAPNKPIRYLVNTHAHFDHSGGLRSFVDAGAIIVTQKANQSFYEQAWAAPRTISPDRLAVSGKPAVFETFSDKHVLSDGQRAIEIHEIAGSGHNDAFALVYLPAEKVLVEADAFTPAVVGAPAPSPVNPYTVNLYDNVRRLKLDVGQIAALHGPRVTTLADLRAAIGLSASAAR